MRNTIIFCLLLSLGAPVAHARTPVPYQVGGYTLGQNIETCRDIVRMNTALPIRYHAYLKEVEIIDLPGYKSGLIQYGTCAKPGQIVRIKLKYQNGDKKFYQELLKRYKQRFGDPDEWRGDPFHVVIGWKWSFKDGNNTISLILQHNTMNAEEKLGNVVKLALTSAIWEEKRCYDAQHQDISQAPTPKRSQGMPSGPKDWQNLIPR